MNLYIPQYMRPQIKAKKITLEAVRSFDPGHTTDGLLLLGPGWGVIRSLGDDGETYNLFCAYHLRSSGIESYLSRCVDYFFVRRPVAEVASELNGIEGVEVSCRA